VLHSILPEAGSGILPAQDAYDQDAPFLDPVKDRMRLKDGAPVAGPHMVDGRVHLRRPADPIQPFRQESLIVPGLGLTETPEAEIRDRR
jgi:hypothetical protein